MRLDVLTDQEAKKRQRIVTYWLSAPGALLGLLVVIDEFRKKGIHGELWIWVIAELQAARNRFTGVGSKGDGR